MRVTESVEDSKALARFTGFRIIVSASGMCEAGRIRHHLKNHLWQSSTTVLLAGLELVLTHWYYPYLVWFYPFAVITLLAI